VPGALISWRHANLPPNSTSPNDMLSIGFTPADATLAYACHAANVGTHQVPDIGTTHDRAAHCTLAADLPPAGVIRDCPVWVDRLNPTLVLVGVWAQDPRTFISSITNYASCNGGRNRTVLGQAQTNDPSSARTTATTHQIT
jgi:hypothetical protein